MGLRCKRCLNLTEFDPIAADFDLVIDAAKVLERAVRAVAGQVSGLVHARARDSAEMITQEAFCSQLGPVQVAASDTCPSNIEFADHAGRHWLQARVENIQLGVCDRPTYGHRTTMRIAGLHLVDAATDDRFSGPVLVDQSGLR